MKSADMSIYSERQRYMLRVLVVIPFIFFLLIYVFQASLDLEPDSYLELSIKYATYLYLLVPSAIMRLFNRKPFLRATTFRMLYMHIVVLILWLVLGITMMLGPDTNDWPPGLLFIWSFSAANIAYYYILTLPSTELLRPEIQTPYKWKRRSRGPF